MGERDPLANRTDAVGRIGDGVVRMGDIMKNLRDWVDVIFKIVLALAGIAVGYYFSHQKQQNDDIKLIVDLATAAESPRRIMGAAIAKQYYDQKRIPGEVYFAVITYANSSSDQQMQALVNSGAAQASREAPAVQQALARVTDALPIQIYFQIRDEADRGAASVLQRQIEAATTPTGKAIIVPGIEAVRGLQSRSVLKCFRKSECQALGPFLVKLFSDNGVPVELIDQSAQYEKTNRRPNLFEAWFAPGAIR